MRLIDANKIEFNTVRYPIGAPWPPNKEEQPTMGEFEFVSKYQIENQPTVDAEPVRHGKWVGKEDQRWHCSECGGIAPKGYRYNYCPDCGAKMDEVEENE